MTALSRRDQEKPVAKEIKETSRITEDEFLSLGDIVTIGKDTARRIARGVVAEIEAMFREKKWEDVVALYHPAQDKLPELADCDSANRVREKIAFALGQLKRFDDAIVELKICLQTDPQNFFLHNALAYTAYNSLYAAKNREVFLSGKHRKDRIDMAHTHFKAAQALRPGGVTNFYREGMLFRQLEDKGRLALPLFLTAVSNWESLSPEEKELRQQERKNYVKALYQGASLQLAEERPQKALEMIQRCLAEDQEKNYLSLTLKYFALGKIHFHMGRFEAARDALVFSLKCRASGPVDFVRELLARVFLGLESPRSGLEQIEKIPRNSRRPYVCWTESDLRIRLRDFDGAKQTLVARAKSDQRSRHKTLVRLARLEYLLGHYRQTETCGKAANTFFEEKWGHGYADGIFWQALGALRSEHLDEARALAESLAAICPDYPELKKLQRHLA